MEEVERNKRGVWKSKSGIKLKHMWDIFHWFILVNTVGFKSWFFFSHKVQL
jgi:hypothetical protein